jgi:CelD/BcsL family acetyltransferase involved in cellulose biosynthesis
VKTGTPDAHSLIGQLADEWEDLADRAGAAPWLRPGWIQAWWAAFGAGRFELASIRRGGRLAALAPLQRSRGRLSSVTNWHTPEYGLLADEPAASGELAEELFARGPRQISLRFMPHDQDVDGLLDIARRAGRTLLVRTLERSPFVPIAGTWEEYERTLPRKLGTELRRRRRRLEERGVLSLAVENGRERLEERLAEGFRVEAAGWKGVRGTAIASDPPTHRFYAEVARWAAARGWLRLAFLRLDERALAFDYCLEWNRSHYLLKTGFDPDFRAFAPGMILRHEMIRRAFSESLRSYEFLGADEAWKLTWAPATRERLHVQAFAPTALGHAERTAYSVGRPLLLRLRRALRR